MSSSSNPRGDESAESLALEHLGVRHVAVQLEAEFAGPASTEIIYSQVDTPDPLPPVHIYDPYDRQIRRVRTPLGRHSYSITPDVSDESSRSHASSASSYEPYPASGRTSSRGSYTARSVTPGGQSHSGFREQVLSIRPRRSSVVELMPSHAIQTITRPITVERPSPVSPRSVDRLSPRRMSISANRTPTVLNSTDYDDRRRGRSAEYQSSSRGGSRHRSRVRIRATSKSDAEHASLQRRSMDVIAAAAAPLTKAWRQTKRVTRALRSCCKSYRREVMIEEYDKLLRRLTRAQDHWAASTIEKVCRWAQQTGQRTKRGRRTSQLLGIPRSGNRIASDAGRLIHSTSDAEPITIIGTAAFPFRQTKASSDGICSAQLDSIQVS